MKPLDVFSLMGWVEENKHRLRPPITNETIYKGNDDFIVMVSGGPNTRKDYHYNETEELFLQLKGAIEIGLVVDGEHRTVTVREGEMFLCPPRVPHQPRRFADTYGLIIEKYREPHQKDAFLYYCEECGHKLYESYFELKDIVKQLPIVQNEFYSSDTLRTCAECGAIMALPTNWEHSLAAMSVDNPYT